MGWSGCWQSAGGQNTGSIQRIRFGPISLRSFFRWHTHAPRAGALSRQEVNVSTTGKGMIVAAQPEAAQAGARVLRQGGNAVDAAMTAALVQGVVDPQMTGIAGFGNCQIFMPGQGVHTCLDFHGKTPQSARPDSCLPDSENARRSVTCTRPSVAPEFHQNCTAGRIWNPSRATRIAG